MSTRQARQAKRYATANSTSRASPARNKTMKSVPKRPDVPKGSNLKAHKYTPRRKGASDGRPGPITSRSRGEPFTIGHVDDVGGVPFKPVNRY